VGPDRRLRSHQTSPPTSTAAARIPNAIQPHGVLFVSSVLLEAAAAPAAAPTTTGGTPDVVVLIVADGVVAVTVCVVVCV